MELHQALEKQSRNLTDFPRKFVGTSLANIEINIGVPHGPAEKRKRGRRSTQLRAKDCENLLAASDHATRIGAPLNRMLTIHFDAAGITEPVKAIGRLLKLMRDWLRCYNTEFTAVWVREAGGGKGEHAHILLSVPPNRIVQFNKRQRGWFRKIGAQWKRGVYLSRPVGGSHYAAFNEATASLYLQAITGALGYILKGASEDAVQVHNLTRISDEGDIWGKRCGTTENIGRAARTRV